MDINSLLGQLAPIAGSALGGAFGGSVGSAFGPVGTAIGNAAGPTVGRWIGDGANWLFGGGNKSQNQNQQQNNPSFQDQIQQAQSSLLSQLQQMPQFRQPQDFGAIERQSMNNLNNKILPSIAERFTGLGSQDSSSYRNALVNAGVQNNQNLDQLRYQHGMDQQNYGLQQQGLLNQRLGQLGGFLGNQGQQQLQQQNIDSANNPYWKAANFGLNALNTAGNLGMQYWNSQDQNEQYSGNKAQQQQQLALGQQFVNKNNPATYGLSEPVAKAIQGLLNYTISNGFGG